MAKQATEATQLTFSDHLRINDIREKAEPVVWTERMLTALINGVKGGKWFSLIDKVYAETTLKAAFMKVKANSGAPGIDHITVKDFERHLESNIRVLNRELDSGNYRPRMVQRTWIDKPGKKGQKRPLGIPTVRDRVVQTALRMVIEPIFENEFAERSYGFRPQRGCKNALKEVTKLLESGYTWVLDADLKSFFDTIDHDIVMEKVEEKISDSRVLDLIRLFLKAGIMDGLKTWTPEKGAPQGAVISPLLANLYLNELDHQMAQNGYHMIRYADDFVILCGNKEEAVMANEQVENHAKEHRLTLHEEKTGIVDASVESFDFLGYRFDKSRKWPSNKSMKRLRDNIRTKTRRTSGQSMEKIIEEVNPTLRGWFNYFMHCHKYTFRPIDGFVRRRLRCILRKRHKRKGISKGRENREWPNAFFRERGLYSLEEAHVLKCQSLQRQYM